MGSKIFYLLIVLTLITLFLVCTDIIEHKLDTIEKNLNEKELRYQNILDSLHNKYDNTLKEYEIILDSLPLGPPLDTIVLQDDFGVRRHPIFGGWQMHSGVDLIDTWKDTVYATGDGVIKFAGWNAGYGRCVTITHIGGYESKYAHLSKTFVKRGESIIDGQPLGKCGSTGDATGQHLHYEVIRNGEVTDPMVYITQTY